MTSLTFGLLQDLPSRVDDDDDDDSVVEKRTYHLKTDGKCNVLIVCTCQLSTAFSDIFLMGSNTPKCGDIKVVIETPTAAEEEEEANGDKAGKTTTKTETKEVAEFFKVSDGLFVCRLKNDLMHSDTLNDLAEKIIEVGSKEVIVLHSEPLVAFKTVDEAPGSTTLTRALMTSQWKKDDLKFRVLERPNVVSGIAAAILTGCEFQEKASLLLLNYSESLNTDSVSLSGFSSLFRVPSIKSLDGQIPRRDANEKLKRLAKLCPENLYL